MGRSSYLIFQRVFLVFFLFFLGHLSCDYIVTADITDIATGIPTLFELTQEGFEKDEVVRIRGLEFQVNGTTSGGVSIKKNGEGEIDQDKVIAFLGIRFGDSTAGVKRWTPSILHPLSPSPSPSPSSSSSNITIHVLDATFFGAACPQTPSPFLRSQPQEDCLFLNIWTPKTALKKSPSSSSASLLPVMVFIHGGAFYMGSANDPYIDGGQLVKSGSEEILLVSINYRLGVLGFLAHPSLTETQPTAPTNFGLLDQRVALLWIQNHIRLFGGDPNRVTIAGESAGAMSVLFHLVALPSPQTLEYPKLFHRAIIQSASANFPTEPLEDAETLGRDFAKGLGCSQEKTSSSLISEVECLRSISVEELLDHQTLNPNTKSYRRAVLFHAAGSNPKRPHPVGDGVNFPKVPGTVEALENAHRDPSIDVIVGSTEDEGTLFVALVFPFLPPSRELFHDVIQVLFSVVEDPVERNAIAQKALDRYFHSDTERRGGGSGSVVNNTLAALSEMLGHLFFTCPTQRSARLLASYSASSSSTASTSSSTRRGRIYNYVFKVRSPDSYLGSFHASELPFIFGTTPGGILFPSSFTPGEELVSKAMIHAWTSFVATGVPTFPERPEIPVREWPEFTLKEEVVEFLNDGEVKVAAKYAVEDCPELWDKIYGQIYYLPLDDLVNEPFWSSFINGYVLASLRYQRNKFLASFALVFFVLVGISWKLVRCCWGTKTKRKVE